MICLDANYVEPARILAMKGAQIVFCPMLTACQMDTLCCQSHHRTITSFPVHLRISSTLLLLILYGMTMGKAAVPASLAYMTAMA